MLLAALLCALSYAAWASPQPFNWYWRAQLAYVPVVWGAYFAFGGSSRWYFIIYSLATACVVLVAGFVAVIFVFANVFERRPTLTSFFSLVVAGCVAYVPYKAIGEFKAQLL